MPAARTPIPATESGGAKHFNAVITSADVVIIKDDDEPHSEWEWTPKSESGRVEIDGDGETHVRSDEDADGKTRKESKGSGDLDVVDARKRRGTKEEEQTDDDASDVEIVSWRRVRDQRTEKHRGTIAEVTGQKSGRTMKKGVAVVKKPEPKGAGRKRKQASS